MEILLLGLLAIAGIPAAIMVCMLAGQCVGGIMNGVSETVAYFRRRPRRVA
jgi:hypothetical protein